MPLNAYDQRKTAGGDATSAGVALALRMLPVADGSDPAVSLQNACAFNNVLGFRPSACRALPDAATPCADICRSWPNRMLKNAVYAAIWA